jgi:XTP/dITP diphosphohydrolase
MEVLSAGALGLPVPEETEDSFLGNARIKAQAAARATGLPALADDSGFSVASLGGDPGVRTADWAELPDGRRTMPWPWRRWRRWRTLPGPACLFSCALVLAWPDGHTEGFLGEVHAPGCIRRAATGLRYDPMFVPEGGRESFGEMEPAVKHAISHRARAFALLREACLGG